MNKQELIEKIGSLDKLYGEKYYVALDDVLDLAKQLDEPEKGSADEAPRYVKNILARLRELPLHDREVWLKAIMGEFERDKATIPPFMAAWINNVKRNGLKRKNSCGYYEEIKSDDSVYRVMYYIFKEGIANKEVKNWVRENTDIFARAWLDGYTIEEKRYRVKMKAIKSNSQYLVFGQLSETWWFGSAEQIGNIKSEHTRKEIEDAGFGEVFNSTLFEVEEVE